MKDTKINWKFSEIAIKHFKVGDMIECVDPGFSLKKGEIYKIKHIKDKMIYVDVPYHQCVNGWMANRFKLLKKEEVK